MSIATIVTMGYGSFGSVNLLPTIGYSIGSALTGPFIVIDRAVFTPGIQGTESEVYTPGAFDLATFTPGAVDQEFWT